MIRNLRETMRQNTEQDWLKTNLERFTRMLQGQRDLATVSTMILSELTPLVSAQHGVFYALTEPGDGSEPMLEFQAGYGYKERKHLSNSFRLGEGLVGQCALEKERILLTDVPGDYIRISSGLGESPPLNIIVLPILFEGSVRAVIELASFSAFSASHQSLLDQLTESIGLVLNTVAATSVTEQLLEQSLSQAKELQSRQEQLHQSNEDLAAQAKLLADKNSEVEGKYQEVEEAKRFVEEKARELSVSSRYKSEFIANMSHELRTPLNSLLVLAEQLEDNPDGNLTERQVQYARVIRSSGVDLLKLLNDILDLAKVESNTVELETSALSLTELRDSMVQTFRPLAERAGSGVLGRARRAAAGHHDDRSASAAAGAEEPALQRVQVHGARRGRAAHGAERGLGDRHQRQRHRDRHQAGAAQGDVRGVRASRRIDRPQVRRHRARALDQSQPRRPARRGHHAGERARARQHVHGQAPAARRRDRGGADQREGRRRTSSSPRSRPAGSCSTTASRPARPC